MATYKNPAVLQGKAVPQQAGELVLPAREVFDFANTAYKPAAIVNTDKIQIGVIPAGCKLVPHLASIQIPIIDTNGAPTGQASIGTATTPAALKAAAAVSGAAQRLTGEDLLPADIGAKDVDVPVYLTFTANVATLQTVGKILADLPVRSYDSSVDVDVT